MNAHDVKDLLQADPNWTTEDGLGDFWMPQAFNTGHAWVGRFKGQGPWARQIDGDSLIYQLEGTCTITVWNDDGPADSTLDPGQFFIIPRGTWHKVRSDDKVVQFGVTGGPTQHSEAEDPTRAG